MISVRLGAIASVFFSQALVWGVALESPAFSATLVHTNDVLGELEPCGCRSNPLGGMARKGNFLKKLGPKPEEILQLDAGDLLFQTETVPDILAPQAQLQAEMLLQAHEMLGQEAVVPGEKDFALGFATFRKLIGKSKVKFLAANLRKKDGGKFLEPYQIFEKGSQRIAVLGLVGEDLRWPSELKATPAIPVAKEMVEKLRKKADVVIALTHQGYEKDQELAEKVPGIDVIVGGHTQTFLQKPTLANGALILQSSFRNQYVGVLPLARNPDGKFDTEAYRIVGLDAGYDSPAETPTAMDELIKRLKKGIAELNSQQEAFASAPLSERKYQTFPRCAECHLKQFEFWRKTRHAGAFGTLHEKDQSKNKDCLSCHSVGLGDPRGFQSVLSLAEVIPQVPKANEGSDAPASSDPPPAIPLSHEELHAFLKQMQSVSSLKSKVKLGAAQPEPMRQAMNHLSRSWTPVQCENCHLPGGEHPFSSSYSKAVEKNTCFKCHTPERAPAWYTPSGQPDWPKIEAKRASISCPAGDLPPESE